MCLCIYVHLYTLNTFIYVYVRFCTFLYVYIHIYTSIYVYVHLYTFMYIYCSHLQRRPWLGSTEEATRKLQALLLPDSSAETAPGAEREGGSAFARTGNAAKWVLCLPMLPFGCVRVCVCVFVCVCVWVHCLIEGGQCIRATGNAAKWVLCLPMLSFGCVCVCVYGCTA